MSAPPGPPAPGDPQHVGPFVVRGRRHADVGGTVLTGQAPDGRAVDLVLLGAGPSSDAAARDRFGAAVTSLAGQRPGVVLGADLQSPWPWAAVASGTPAAPLLTEALGPVTEPAQRGPQFAPHWYAGHPPARRAAPVAAAAQTVSRRWWWVAAALTVLVVLLLLLWWVLQPPAEQELGPQPVPVPTQPAPGAPPLPVPPTPLPPTPLPEPSPSPDSSPGLLPGQPLPTAPAGLGPSGPRFGPDDGATTLDLADLAFDVTVPATWGCLRSDRGPVGSVRWVCVDETWGIDNGQPPGGVVQQMPCPQPCGAAEWAALQQANAPGTLWAAVDERTAAVEDLDPVTAGYVRFQLSRVFAAAPGGPVDTHVFVRVAVPPEKRDVALKIVNGVVAATP